MEVDEAANEVEATLTPLMSGCPICERPIEKGARILFATDRQILAEKMKRCSYAWL